MGLHCREITRRLHAGHLGLHVLRRPRRDHRPQRRHRVGLHQPRDPTSPTSSSSRPRATTATSATTEPRRWRCAPRPSRSRGEDDVELRVRETVHGPLISDVSAEFATVGANAPHRRAGRAGERVRRRAGVDRAGARARPPTRSSTSTAAPDWDEFRAAAADFAVPAQNLVYADREGHIGDQSPGRIPIRRAGNDGTHARRGLDQRQRLDRRLRPSTGCRASSTPRRGSS